MKRMKVPDYKEKSVFGVPLIIHVQRCGFPLPLCLQQALSHLRTRCLDQVREIFKKLNWSMYISSHQNAKCRLFRSVSDQHLLFFFFAFSSNSYHLQPNYLVFIDILAAPNKKGGRGTLR